MNVLIACEFSGVVRDAFAARGHNAWSCDLLPTEKPGKHIQGNLVDHIDGYYPGHGRPPIEWDFIGFHTDCTFMCNSGVRWLTTNPSRWEKLDKACQLFNLCLRHGAKGYQENPIPHKHAVERIDRNYDQIIQPWQFGHGEIKATCLWLKNLPLLQPTNIVPGRTARVHREPPSPDRWKNRSRTLQGIADAMASQWG